MTCICDLFQTLHFHSVKFMYMLEILRSKKGCPILLNLSQILGKINTLQGQFLYVQTPIKSFFQF